MKTRIVFLPIFVFILMLTACAGDAGVEVDLPEEGFDF